MLDGIRVLDFTRVMAGPYATRLLADFGAEVIKVQSRLTAVGSEANSTTYFQTWNRNKKSITLNLNRVEARDLALRLTAVSDVVMENFSPRVMENWRLTYETLRTVRPDLVMLSMSAMGQSGPQRNTVAYGPTIHAASGFSYLSAYGEEVPVGPGNAYADPVAGLYGAFAVLAALEERERTGRGQYIDLSTYEAMASLLGPALLDASVNPSPSKPAGNGPGDTPAAPHGCYRCQGNDDWCVIAVFDDHQWKALCRVLGGDSMAESPALKTLEQRRQNLAELDALIEAWTSQRSASTVVDTLQKAGIPAGIVQDAVDLLKDPQLAHRRFFLPLEHPRLGRTVSESSPLKFRSYSEKQSGAAPDLGEHNRYVFQELLGIEADVYETLVRWNVI